MNNIFEQAMAHYVIFFVMQDQVSIRGLRWSLRRSLEVVSASYKQLFQAVVDPQSGYVNPSPGIVNKTPEQIDLLLQLWFTNRMLLKNLFQCWEYQLKETHVAITLYWANNDAQASGMFRNAK